MAKEEVIEIVKEENAVLKSIVDRSGQKPEVDSLVEGPVILVEKSSVYVDLSPYGTGIIYGREFINAKDIIKKISLGDTIKAKVVEAENDEGYVELSLKEAKQALTWSEAEKAIKAKTILNLEIKDANKGGLILEWQGIQGFLPASQLKADHYPRVLDSDKDKILKELKKLVGEKISVMIISTLPKEGKLIFSEKDNNPEEKKEILSKYTVGDDLDCTVAGLVDFGVFLKLEDGLEGLVHISEIDWGLVEDPRTMFKVGDKVRAKVIEIKEGKISLSIKALKENPWNEFEGKLKKGDIIKGVVIKYNKHGALVAIKEGVAGLVHNSTFGSEAKLREKLELGKNYNFQITLFEPKDHKMTLVHLEQA
ncbi:MAG: S1 RNA-binding domain-containing protein [Candidatus Pacebacteria bacterium]|jgi:small subunit ribosomal protein S1|nr:S1 RNA-binding domain-containing protein [Candidatus Paceibacterota bacterium]